MGARERVSEPAAAGNGQGSPHGSEAPHCLEKVAHYFDLICTRYSKRCVDSKRVSYEMHLFWGSKIFFFFYFSRSCACGRCERFREGLPANEQRGSTLME